MNDMAGLAEEIIWTERTKAFTAALMNPDQGAPEGIGKGDDAAPKRFSVYRNNVVVSLVEAVKATFPSILALLGDETFSRLARAFIVRHPPTSPMMQQYGKAFPDYLAGLPALSELPFLPDVARTELAWLQSYHAADDAPLVPEEIGALAPEDAMQTVLAARASTRVITSAYAAGDLFNARFEWPTGQSDFSEAQTLLITRPDYSVELRALPPALGLFFSTLINGEPLAHALGAAMEIEADFDAGGAIALMLESGAFSTLQQQK